MCVWHKTTIFYYFPPQVTVIIEAYSSGIINVCSNKHLHSSKSTWIKQIIMTEVEFCEFSKLSHPLCSKVVFKRS